MKAPKLSPGDVVRYSGRHLRQIGCATGPEGQKRWTVKACACSQCTAGTWVNLGVPAAGYEDCDLHCTPSALVKVGTVDRRDVDVDPRFPIT